MERGAEALGGMLLCVVLGGRAALEQVDSMRISAGCREAAAWKLLIWCPAAIMHPIDCTSTLHKYAGGQRVCTPHQRRVHGDLVLPSYVMLPVHEPSNPPLWSLTTLGYYGLGIAIFLLDADTTIKRD